MIVNKDKLFVKQDAGNVPYNNQVFNTSIALGESLSEDQLKAVKELKDNYPEYSKFMTISINNAKKSNDVRVKIGAKAFNSELANVRINALLNDVLNKLEEFGYEKKYIRNIAAQALAYPEYYLYSIEVGFKHMLEEIPSKEVIGEIKYNEETGNWEINNMEFETYQAAVDYSKRDESLSQQGTQLSEAVLFGTELISDVSDKLSELDIYPQNIFETEYGFCVVYEGTRKEHKQLDDILLNYLADNETKGTVESVPVGIDIENYYTVNHFVKYLPLHEKLKQRKLLGESTMSKILKESFTATSEEQREQINKLIKNALVALDNFKRYTFDLYEELKTCDKDSAGFLYTDILMDIDNLYEPFNDLNYIPLEDDEE